MATIRVSGGGDAISTAWASASDGDTLLVADGTYNVPTRPTTPPDVAFVSENGPTNCIIQGNGTNDNLVFGTAASAKKCTITGFTIKDVPGASSNTVGGTFKWINGVYRCIYIGACRAALCYGVTEVCDLLAIISYSGTQAESSRLALRSSVTIRNCTIIFTGTTPFGRVAGAANGHLYANVLVWCAGSYTVPFVAGSGSSTATYRFYNCMAQDLGWILDFEGNLSEGCVEISENPFFNYAEGDYRPKGPAATMGNPDYLPSGGDLYSNSWAAPAVGCLLGDIFRTTDWLPDHTNILGNGPIKSVKGVEKWWMHFIGDEDGTDISMEAVPYNGTDPPSVSLEYSLDGRKWLPFYVGHTHIVLRAGGMAFLRAPEGVSNGSFGDTTTYSNAALLTDYNKFVIDGMAYCKGSILSIFSNSPGSSLMMRAPGLFRACAGLLSTPDICNELTTDGMVNAYNAAFMFNQCTGIETLGKFMARSYSSSYHALQFMFVACSSLKSAASMLIDFYSTNAQRMFSGCTSLKFPPTVSNVTGGGTVATYCFRECFNNCSSLISPLDMSWITGVNTYGMYCMYQNCTSLTESPVFPNANYNSTQSLGRMFNGCTALSTITTNMTAWPSGTSSTLYWCQNVPMVSSSKFYCPSALGTDSTITRGTSNCPTNWTVINI